MAKMFSVQLGGSLSGTPELDRAHRSLQPKPRPGAAPQPFIVRFHRYTEKDAVLNWAKSHKDDYIQPVTVSLRTTRNTSLTLPKTQRRSTLKTSPRSRLPWIIADCIDLR